MPDTKIPSEKEMDKTLDLIKEGYMFIKNRCDELQTDVFESHLLGEKVICMFGEEAVKIFYDTCKFERKNAAPKRVQKTLTGENAIQGMDGQAHLHRKQLFMSLMNKPNQEKLAGLFMEKWMASINVWESSDEIVLFNEAKDKLCQAACQWAGIPLSDSEVNERADDFVLMIDAFGAMGPRHWKGRRARTRAEDWMQGIIADVRLGKISAEENSALYAFSFHKDLNGSILEERMAAIELINVIRPIVAVSTYIAFLALALHDNPQCIPSLLSGDEEYYEMFVQEVRRFYPFTPFMGARVKQDFTWNGCEFSMGTLVLLDAYGTDHDSRIWQEPSAFNPERFRDWTGNKFGFIPQGGGNPSAGHRCPGEGIVVDIMKAALDFLVNKIEYQVPEQDLSFSLARIPTLPESKIILTNIKRKA